MALLVMQIRCEECNHLFSVRRPRASTYDLIPSIISAIKCPHCHPEALVDVCAACRLPLSIMPRGRNTVRSYLCFSCFQRYRRAALQTTPA